MTALPICSLDFETRSVLDVTDVGVFAYAEDPHIGVWCMSYQIGDGPVQRWTGGAMPDDLAQHLRASGLFAAWNAQFEATIWEVVLHQRCGWPAPRPEQWVCTAALAARADLPRSLGECAKALKINEQKDKAGHDLMLKLCRPKSVAPDGWPTWYDPNDPEDAPLFQQLYAYCDQDVRTERAIFEALPKVGDPTERKIWLLDQQINRRGVRIDVPLVKSMLDLAASTTEDINAALKDATKGVVTKATQTKRLTTYLEAEGLALPSLDKAHLRDALADPMLRESLRSILELRRQGAKASVAKLTKMLECLCVDERIRGMLLYYGAGPGRWSGKLVQPQNFPRPTVVITEDVIDLTRAGDGDALDALAPVMEILASMLRGCFIPAEGHDFVVADYSAIEARVLAWLAGAETLLRQFAMGISPYPPMGVPIFGAPAPKNGDPFKYQVCKNTVLGCGYQMGADRFQEQAWEQTGLRLPSELCEKAVTAYRSTHHEIPAFWKAINGVAKLVVREAREEWTPVLDGKVAFRMDGHYLRMRLPQGRSLWYPEAKLGLRLVEFKDKETGEIRREKVLSVTAAGVNPVTRKWGRFALYGGLLTENAVQATARDLMADAMLRLEPAGYPTVLTVHDEIVTEPVLGHGSVEDFCTLMSATPAWATGCPVAAEGWRGPRWRK